MAGWRAEMKLADVSPDYEIEVECRGCHKSYMVWPANLLKEDGYTALFMEEVQARLKCRDKHCTGRVKIALLYDHLVTSFIGGMP
ncbi:MAG: hypothetical protein WBQ60_07910 [Asticcacaulis sp.]